jgi:hypothetical protein
MFDEYLPEVMLACPSCGASSDGWQGKDGPCALFVWQQGKAHPIAQRADEPLDNASLRSFVLPDSFGFYTRCPNGHFVEAKGRCVDGVWAETTLLMA